MKAVLCAVISAFIIFAPFAIRVFFIVDSNVKKMYFTLNLFGLNIIGGYITVNGKFICIHVSDKKCFLVDYIKAIAKNKKMFKIGTVEIFEINSLYKCDVENFTDNLYLYSLALGANEAICALINAKKPFLKIKNQIEIDNAENGIAFAKITLVLNIFAIAKSLLKKIVEKVVNGKRKKQH